MSLRVVNVGEGEDGQAWAAALSDPAWVEGSEVLKEDGDVIVRRARVLGREVVVKRWGLTRLKRRVQAVFNATPGCRHWRGAARVAGAGERTARVFAMARGSDDRGPCELLVMERLEGRSVLEHVARPTLGVRGQHELARCVGRHIARLAAKGVVNSDGKASNLIVIEDGDTFQIGVIDCGAMGGMTDDEPADSLGVLVVEMIGVGHPPRLALAMRTVLSLIDAWGSPSVSRGAFRNDVWEGVRKFLRHHGDPTPKVDPLVRGGGRATPPPGDGVS